MASGRAADVQFALQRAKRKISELQQQLKETKSETPQTSQTTRIPSKELQDSLVDMYTANPRVNVELRQRLPSLARSQLISPDRSGISLNQDLNTWPQAPQHLQELSTSCSPSPPSHRRSASPVSPPLFRKSVSPVSPPLFRRSVSPVSPPLFRRSVSPVSPPLFRRSVSPVSPLFQRRSVSPLSSRHPGRAGEMEMDLSPSRGPSPWAQSCGDATVEGTAPRGPGSPSLKRHLVTAVDSSNQTSSSTWPQGFDQDKNISFLLKELDAVREINNKLQEQLVQKEKELQRREVEEELREEQREARDWERPAAVLEEVLTAQKDRDKALMSRLLLANEERDEALLRLRRLQQAAESEGFHLDDTNQDVDELLRRICDADSVQEIQQFGSALVHRLQLARQRRSDITVQEMKAVMEERDGSVAKWKRMEQEMLQGKEQWASEELLRLQRERDTALEDRQRLEAEIQALRANHSPQEIDLPSQHPEALPLMDQLQQLTKEKQNVEAELQRCQEAEREASERVRRWTSSSCEALAASSFIRAAQTVSQSRLERLVEVLRKKVGAGSVRAVI